jgi:hypothetical protein
MKVIGAIRNALSFGDHNIRHIEDMRNSPGERRERGHS